MRDHLELGHVCVGLFSLFIDLGRPSLNVGDTISGCGSLDYIRVEEAS